MEPGYARAIIEAGIIMAIILTIVGLLARTVFRSERYFQAFESAFLSRDQAYGAIHQIRWNLISIRTDLNLLRLKEVDVSIFQRAYTDYLSHTEGLESKYKLINLRFPTLHANFGEYVSRTRKYQQISVLFGEQYTEACQLLAEVLILFNQVDPLVNSLYLVAKH